MVLFILIDAFGWEWLEKTGFMDDIIEYKMPLKTVLGYSSSAIPCILTGKTPEEHNQWNLFYLSPDNSPFKWIKRSKLLNNEYVINNKYTREILRRIAQKISGYSGTFSFPCIPFKEVGMLPGDYFSYFDICEKKWIYNAGSFESAENIFDYLLKNDIPYNIYTYNRFSEEGIVKEVSKHIEQTKYEFYFLYFTELDKLLHLHCHESDIIVNKIKWYEEQVKKLYDLAIKHYNDCSLIVCSDHGMAEITNSVDLMSEMKKLDLEFGKDYIALYDSTMARFWFFNENAKTKVYNLLCNLDCGKLLSDEDLKNLGILFKDRRYGEIIFLLNEGGIIHPGMMGNLWKPKGMHGYHPDCSSSNAIFMTNTEVKLKPDSIIDLFEIAKDVSMSCRK